MLRAAASRGEWSNNTLNEMYKQAQAPSEHRRTEAAGLLRAHQPTISVRKSLQDGGGAAPR